MNISIRKSKIDDMAGLQEIFAVARRFMAETGNPRQWTDGYPSEQLLREDILSGDSYVIEYYGETVATFLLRGGEDPTYRNIYGGAWLDNGPYATIHRIAGSGKMKGVVHTAVAFALQSFDSIRIDTHRNNLVMQRALGKEGFAYCGIIRCWNGSERLAYQLRRHND